ncbi:hypothetical protein FOA52_006079 [Chlamydomonas sp. UWO 241]|nr:hypothetical protein FOA52_006079 [Chlamydomonas sp. UWO 241]
MADVPAVVAGLGHATCTLVAHDWGGMIAWFVAADRPDVIDRLIVLAAPHLGLAQVRFGGGGGFAADRPGVVDRLIVVWRLAEPHLGLAQVRV